MTLLNDSAVSVVLSLGFEVFVKSSVVLAIAGIAIFLARNSSAAGRHVVWAMSLGVLLLMPFASVVLPDWSVDGLSIPAAVESNSEINPVINLAADRGPQYKTEQRVAHAKVPESHGAPPSPSRPASTATSGGAIPTRSIVDAVAVLVWVGGATLLLIRFVLSALSARAISKRAAAHGVMRSVRVSNRFGIPGSVRVVTSGEVSMPICWGLFNPVVVLPSASSEWPSDRKSAVMLHELAHATRCDYLAHVVGELACAFYWPNPLVWIAARKAAMEREHACDDEALNVGMRSDVYARHLLDVVSSQMGAAAPAGAIAMAGRSDLATRVRKILERGLSRNPMSRKVFVLATTVAIAVTLPIATFELFAETDGHPFVSDSMRNQGPRSVRERIEELRSGDPGIRRYAAWSLGELEDERGVSPLHESLSDPDADVRLVSAWALGEIKHRRSVDPLVEALDDPDLLVREMAVLALGEIGHSRAIEPLIDVVERDDSLTWPVVWALGEIDSYDAYEARLAVFRSLGRRPFDNTEVWAGQWHGWQEPFSRRDLFALQRALRDEDPEARQLAAWELGHLDEENAVESLLDLLRDSDPTVRAMAIWALDETNPSRRRRRVAD